MDNKYYHILFEISLLNGYGLLRKFLSKDEIKLCNELVKLEYLHKGKSDEKNGTTAFYITKKGEKYLETIN